MKKKLGLMAAWLAGTILAGAAAWAAVSVVGAEVTDSPVRPLSAGEVAGLNAIAATAGTDGSASTPTASTTASTTATPTSEPPETSPPTSSNEPIDAAVNSTPAPTAPPTTRAPTPPTSTTVTTPTPQQKWYTLTGGIVVLVVGQGTVNVASAQPKQGFSAVVVDAGPSRVKVEFESRNHESSLKAEFKVGVLDVSIEESGEHD